MGESCFSQNPSLNPCSLSPSGPFLPCPSGEGKTCGRGLLSVTVTVTVAGKGTLCTVNVYCRHTPALSSHPTPSTPAARLFHSSQETRRLSVENLISPRGKILRYWHQGSPQQMIHYSHTIVWKSTSPNQELRASNQLFISQLLSCVGQDWYTHTQLIALKT